MTRRLMAGARLNEWLTLGLITGGALALRLVHLTRFELWVDEAATWWFAQVTASGNMTRVETAEEDRIMEILVLDARLPNNRSGITQIFDTEIYVQVKRKFHTRVAGELEQFRNEIRAEITAIWRTSDPQHFQEPKLENLTRKVYALLNGRFGRDPVSGEPIISKSVIVMGTGLRIDT